MTDREPEDLSSADLLSPDEERELANALRAAWSPGEIDPELNRRLVELALEDPLAPPTAEEIVESERLRRALEGEGEHPGADLFAAIGAAVRPTAPNPERVRELAGRAAKRSPMRSNVISVAFGAGAAALALAAAIALWVAPKSDRELGTAARASAERAEIAVRVAFSRSTAPLFDEKFEVGQATARIDRIASARARDLRSNRYRRWGIR